MVVIAIVGVLAASAMAMINPVKQMQRAKDSQRKTDLKQLQAALELYRADYGYYPPIAEFPPSCGAAFSKSGVTYIAKMPCDGKAGGGWRDYTYNRSAASTYTITACIENDKDPDTAVTNIETGTCSSGKVFTVYSP